MDVKTLIEALAKVDRDHFIIVEEDCVEVYRKDLYFPTPAPVETLKAWNDETLTNAVTEIFPAPHLPCVESEQGYPCAKYANTGD